MPKQSRSVKSKSNKPNKLDRPNRKQKTKKIDAFRKSAFVDHDHPFKPKKDKFKTYKRKVLKNV